MTATDWSQPQPVSDIELAFPATVAHLMPTLEEIPAEFQDWGGRGDAAKWVKFQSDWFFHGLTDAAFTPKPGIDVAAAKRHLAAIQGSFEPKHEHKQAAVAWLASLWFEDVAYTAGRVHA